MTPRSTPSRPRRTLNRLAWAVLALVLGLAAQTALRGEDQLFAGLALLGVATLLFVLMLQHADRRALLTPPYRGFFAPVRWAGNWRRTAALGLFVVALAATVGSWRFFTLGDEALNLAWVLYAVAILTLLTAVFLLFPSRHQSSPRSLSLSKERLSSASRFDTLKTFFYRYWPLAAIVLLALALRLWQFGELPFGVWYDEAEAGLQARRWLNETAYKPAYYSPINVSGQFLWLYAAALRFISDTVFGLRAVSVAFGIGGVLAGYGFGRQIRGHWFGLALAFVLAVMRWDINFSRIAMTGIDAPFFILLSLWFLARTLRYGRLRDVALAGLFVGLGLSFYTAFRLFVLALAVFVLVLTLFFPHWLTRLTHRRWLLENGLRLLIFVAVVGVTLLPVIHFAANQPEEFLYRLQITSVAFKHDAPTVGAAVWNNVKKHAAMFHIAGDRNGRHNLPGEPMLDPLTGTLMVFGLGLALRRFRYPDHLFFIILLPVSLVGGILSVDFEAPQSLRSIAAIPAVAYFAALSLDVLGREAVRVWRPLSLRWLWLPAGGLAVYLLFSNVHTYFVRQANDFAVWNAFSTPETITGKKMAELGPDYTYYFSPFLMNQPTITFLAPQMPGPQVLPLPDPLPVRTPADRPAAMFIHADDGWVLEKGRSIYADAEFETVRFKPDSLPSLHTGVLSRADIASVQGLALRYWAGHTIQPNQVPLKALTVPTVNVDWRTALPTTPPFTAEWRGVLYAAQYGPYQFVVETDGRWVLEIDGLEVAAGQGSSAPLVWELAEGNHPFNFKLFAETGNEVAQLRWIPPGAAEHVIPTQNFYHDPVSYNGLLGNYYNNPNWEGEPVYRIIDPRLDIYFHFVPLSRPYSVQWLGQLNVPVTGVYRLGVNAVSRAEVRLDGRPVAASNAPNQYAEGSVSLSAGLHDLEVNFVDADDRSQIRLYWVRPDTGERQIIPESQLYPPLGENWQPETPTVALVADFVPQDLTLQPQGTLAQGLRQPRDVAVSSDGIVYVADTGLPGVAVFPPGATTPEAVWQTAPDGPLVEPLGLVTDDNDLLYVLDSTRQWIDVFAPNGDVVNQIGGPDAYFYHPRGLSLLGGDLVVANTGSGEVVIYNRDGERLAAVGRHGDAPGMLNEPVDVWQDEFGAYYVTEGANVNRWQRLDPFGKPLGLWPVQNPPALDGSHLAALPDGSLLMTNAQTQSLRRYSPDGVLLSEWTEIGGVQFNRPVGIFVDSSGQRLFITDVATGQVYIFGFSLG